MPTQLDDDPRTARTSEPAGYDFNNPDFDDIKQSTTGLQDQLGALERDKLQRLEANPDTGSSGANENPFGYAKEDERPQAQNNSRWGKAANWALDRRKKIGFAVAGGGLTIAAAMAFFTLAIAPIAFLDGLIPDLDTSVGSLVMAHNSLLVSKLMYSSEAVSGCKALSIRCKFSTMSKEQIARYERAGFTIEKGETSKFLGRSKPKSITFQEKTYTPEEFLKAKASNPALRNADIRANNMRYLGSVTSRFASAVLAKFGVTKQKPSLSGSRTDRLNQLLTATGSSDASEVRFTETTDEDGNKKWKLEGDESGALYNEDQVKKAQTALKERPVLGKIQAVQSTATFQNLIKGVSILGYADLGCSLYNMVGAAGVGAKINTIDALVKFGQPIFALIQSIKAGDQTEASEDIAAVAELLTKVDTRKEIWDGDKLVANPNYNSSAMTSPLVQMSGDGKVRSVTTETLQFSSGLSVEKLLGGAGAAYTWIQQNITKTGCAFVQNWFVRGASLVLGVVAAIGSSGASFAATAAISGGIMVAMYAAQVALNNALHGPDLQTAFEDGSTEAVGSALWLGLAGEMGTHAASTGQVPGTTSQIVNYQKTVLNEVNTQYAEVEKEDAKNNPFDVTNQYSFLGSAARQYGKATNYGSSPVSVMAGIVALATGTGISTTTASATTDLSEERFEQCSDNAYKTLGVNADAGCNLRYVMLPEDIKKLQQEGAALTVAKWMEDNGYVEKDTTDGLPIGYQPIDTSQAQNAALQFVTGAAEGFVNQFYNTRQYGTGIAADYGKYLDYCVYRTMPYGEQFAESSAINGVEDGWITGKKCLEPSGAVSYFRVYTSLLAAQAAEDEERPVATASSANSGVCPTGSAVADKITQGYWDDGYQDSVFCVIDGTTDGSMTGIKDADIFKANNDVLQTNDTGKVVVRQDAAQDMVNLVKKYQETTKKTTFDVTFSYRSHNQQCLMFFYEWGLSSLPEKCSGGTLTQNQAAALSSKMDGEYEMPRSSSSPPNYGLYTSNHESGHAFDASDLGWVNTCASSDYDGAEYKSNTCYNFSSDNIPSDASHVSWKGD